MNEIEQKVDSLFNSNPILSLPFLVIYNHYCQIATRALLDEKQFPFHLATPFTHILERDLDFSELSLEKCTELSYTIQLDDFRSLMECANLNIVFPFIHSGVYSYKKESEHISHIDYRNNKVMDHEVRDTVLTNLSLPVIPPLHAPIKDFATSCISRLKRGEPLQVYKSINHINNIYNLTRDAFSESIIVPDQFFEHVGFSSAESFRNIRSAFCALGQAYIDSAYIVDLYLTKNALHDTERGQSLWNGIAMARLKNTDLKDLILRVSRGTPKDYDKFFEFFSCGAGLNKGISKKFMPPFWKIENNIYFLPGAVPVLLGTRNLLISIQNDMDKKKIYNYDGEISCLFEPALLERAEFHFRKYGFSTVIGKNFTGGELDLAVYCEKSNTILTIQAKATLYPESARMVRRLDDRIAEAITQTTKFDALPPEEKLRTFQDCFPDHGKLFSVNHICGVLTSSGFGSFKSWDGMKSKDIIPLNCNILSHTLPHCETLELLSEQSEKYIEKIVESSKAELTEKIFRLAGHTIHQKHIEPTEINKLHMLEYSGQ